MTAPRYIPVLDAAALLGISARSYYRGVDAGELPGLRIGKRITVPVAPLEELVGELTGCVTVPEAAAILLISPALYRAAARRGELPLRRIGHRQVVPLSALDQLARIA